MKTFILKWCLLFVFLLNGVSAEELLKAQTSWDGGAISYPKGQIEITSEKIRIEENQVTQFHCHPVPTFGYVLQGAVEVEINNGKKTILTEGESAIEVMRTIHRGRAINGPVEIIVFYAGSTTLPTTVLPDNDVNKEHCKF